MTGVRVLLAIACLGYLADLVAYFFVPDLEAYVTPFSAVAGVLGEFGFTTWLLVKAVPTTRAAPAAAAVRGELVATGGR